MKKILPLVLTALFVPSIAFAAWWNPLSWFAKKPSEVPVVVENAPIATLDCPQPTVPDVVVSNEPKLIEKIVEKPVIKTQTITVQDPALQAKIDVLVKSNNDLQAKYSTLASQYNTLAETNISLKEQLSAKGMTPTTPEPTSSLSELVVSTQESNTANYREVGLLNRSSQLLTVTRLTFTPYPDTVFKVRASKVQLNNPSLTTYPSTSPIQIILDSPLYIEPRSSATIYIYGQNIWKLTAIERSGVENAIGLPVGIDIHQ